MVEDTFVIEASIGGVQLKLSTGDDKSFSLKRSAHQVCVDFASFTGTLSISHPSSSGEAVHEPTVSQQQKAEVEVTAVISQECAPQTSSDEDQDHSTFSALAERSRNEKRRQDESKRAAPPERMDIDPEQNERKDHSTPIALLERSLDEEIVETASKPNKCQEKHKVPRRRPPAPPPRFLESVEESVLLRFQQPLQTGSTMIESAESHSGLLSLRSRSVRESTQLETMVSKNDLCVRLKESLDRYDTIVEQTMEEAGEESVCSSGASESLSNLQLACAKPKISARELQAILDEDPHAASEADSEGRFPLHILSENETLLSTFVRSKTARDFCLNLFEAYPEALIIRDNTGAFPFVHLIHNWVDDAYLYANVINAEPRKELIRTFRTTGKLWSLFGQDSDRSRGPNREESSRRIKFPRVVLTRQAQVSFEILSSFLDRLNESYHQGGFDRNANMLVRSVIAHSIANIPNLLKTVFLIDDTDKRHWVSCCSIIERVFFCYESTGDWVSNMIHRGSDPSRRAVDYLVEVSGLTVADYIGPGRSPRTDDDKAYERDRNTVFATLEASSPLIQSLTVLSNEEKGRAATTDAVWMILNHCLSNPLVVGFLLADFVFSIVLLQTFRFVSNTNKISLFGRENQTLVGQEATTLFLSVCFYFLLRKLSEFYSLLKLSVRAFRSYLRDFWNIVDVAAISLSLATVLSQTESPLLLALAMASLWLKLLGLLRAMNAHLATFILAILEIVKDIRWFLLVLAIAIFCFADVIHIITVHAEDGAYCDSSGTAPDEFCSASVLPVYLKLYAVIVGDVNLEDFSYASGIEFLFVLFTLMGIIILLNVLIAVVADSYKKSVFNARYLFGRARVDFAITFVAQENLLKSGDAPDMESWRSLFTRQYGAWLLGSVCRLILLTSLFFTSGYSVFILVTMARSMEEMGTAETVWWCSLTVIFGILLLVSNTLVAGNMLEKPTRRMAAKLRLSGLIVILDTVSRTAEVFARRTFGIGSPDSYKQATETDPRIKLLQESMFRIVSSAKESIARNLDAAEQRIKANATTIAESFYAALS